MPVLLFFLLAYPVHAFRIPLSASSTSSVQDLSANSFDVDIVIPASCEKDRGLLHADAAGAMVERDRDNDELTYTLRSIRKNARWARQIYVLQNPHCKERWETRSIPEPDKTTWVDRCTLYPISQRNQYCPTRNSFSVMTIVHRIPKLNKHFIYVEDDDLVIKPTTVETFYTKGRPKCHRTLTADVYRMELNTGLKHADIPNSSQGLFHTWVPLTRDLAQDIEEKYPKWIEFVRSHWKGWYSSVLNECGTSASEKENSLEEDFNAVWWAYMNENSLCSEVSDDNILFQDSREGDWSHWDSMFHDPHRIILNINDDMSTSNMSLYQKQHEDGILKMNAVFGSLIEKRLGSRLEWLEHHFPEDQGSQPATYRADVFLEYALWFVVCFCLTSGFWITSSTSLGLYTSSQVGAFVGYVFVFLLTLFLTRAVKGEAPDPLCLMFGINATKIVLSAVLFLVQDAKGHSLQSILQILQDGGGMVLVVKYFILAVVFVTTDILRITFIQNYGPATYDVMINVRSMFLAWMWQQIMNEQLTRYQWFGLGLITFGCFCKAAMDNEGAPTAGCDSHMVAELSAMVFLNSISAVYNEKLLKHVNVPVNIQNLLLYGSSQFWLTLGLLMWQHQHTSFSGDGHLRAQIGLFLQPMVLVTVLVYASLGVVTAQFLKLLSAVAKEVAAGTHLIISIPLDALLFQKRFDPISGCTGVVVLLGILVYSRAEDQAGDSVSKV